MNNDVRLSPAQVKSARRLRLEAMRLQEIEGNPLTAEDVAMFEMFEREAWTHEQRLAYILAEARALGDQAKGSTLSRNRN